MKLLKYGFYLLAIAASAVSCTRKGNNRSAAGRLGRRDDEKLQRLVDFHRPIRSEG